jgi:hypothetical protein
MTEVVSPESLALKKIHEILHPHGDPDHEWCPEHIERIAEVLYEVIPRPQPNPYEQVNEKVLALDGAYHHLGEIGWGQENAGEVRATLEYAQDTLLEISALIEATREERVERVGGLLDNLRAAGHALNEGKFEAPADVAARLLEIADEIEAVP